MKIAIIGAGLIGRAWAIVFARGGHAVTLFDSDTKQSAAALEWVKTALDDMHSFDLISDPEAIRNQITAASRLPEALNGCGYVQENIAELLEPKQALFAEVEALAPKDAILTSSSSALRPSLIFANIKTPQRCLVVHPMNPPHLAPIAELCGSGKTSAQTVDRTRAIMLECGMTPIVVKREIDGFVLNRLQSSLLNEAFRLIAFGYVSPEDLDKTLSDGLALRWSFMGPVETIDLNAPLGVADYMQRYGPTIRRIATPPKGEETWPDSVGGIMEVARRAQVPKDRLAAAQAWRDRRLMTLAAHKKQAEK
ncbi:MAG: 3-hydroxyacyl-CoA dehydrogenase [Rhodomicrobium sp.]|nr:3-hydroxyacyl-CoA dehydrogenase [Rhodomicrobium sp.]